MTKNILYPAIEPFESGMLRVSPLHEIYYEVSGNPKGKPVIVCHGGPGGGSNPSMRRFFDPARYRIHLFDQRGCGRSTPHAELRENTTWHLIEDIEALRTLFGVEAWQVFGGSWGSTLALTYALTHSGRVTELVLRGIFTLRREELLWFYQEGASWVFPEAWEKFVAPIPKAERDDLMAAYHRRLTSPERTTQIEAAKRWSVWEGSTITLMPSPERERSFAHDGFALAFARIECHYFMNAGFYDEDGWILKNANLLRDLPGTIVQGRFDVVTPAKTAHELHCAWPQSKLVIVDDAGHAASEPGIVSALVEATNAYA